MEELPLDEKALETRREEVLALFEARLGRWLPVQGAAFALVAVALGGFVAFQVAVPLLVTVVTVAAAGVAVSAGVQAAYEADFRREMTSLQDQFETLKGRRGNL